MAAATKAFAEHGYARVGVKAVCARAGVTTGALYHHFGGKPELYREVRKSEEARLMSVMADAARGAAPGARAVRLALLAAWDLAQAEGSQRLFSDPPAQAGADALSGFLQALWPWGPAAVGPVLTAAWLGALGDSLANPGGDARRVLDGILRGLAGDIS